MSETAALDCARSGEEGQIAESARQLEERFSILQPSLLLHPIQAQGRRGEGRTMADLAVPALDTCAMTGSRFVCRSPGSAFAGQREGSMEMVLFPTIDNNVASEKGASVRLADVLTSFAGRQTEASPAACHDGQLHGDGRGDAALGEDDVAAIWQLLFALFPLPRPRPAFPLLMMGRIVMEPHHFPGSRHGRLPTGKAFSLPSPPPRVSSARAGSIKATPPPSLLGNPDSWFRATG